MSRYGRITRRASLVALWGGVCFLAGCELLTLYAIYEVVDRYISRDRGDRTTRVVYELRSTSAGEPLIAGARIELFALRTGGSPSNPNDYDTVADAVRETNAQGEAVVYVKSDPNEPGDNVIRPGTTYQELVTAAGFVPYRGVLDPIDARDGLVERDPIRLVPVE